MAVTAEIVYNHLPAIAKKLPGVVRRIVQETAFEIESTAKINVPVDTGNLRASITTEMTGETSAVVGTNVEYSIYVEMGTSRQSPQPYLLPAAEQARPRFIAKLRNLEASLG